MVATAGRATLNGVVSLFLAATFLFPYVGGSVTAYVLIGLSVILIVWNLVSPPRIAFDPGAWLFVASWVLIAVAFAITNVAPRTDFLFALNFVMFALYPLLAGALQRFSAPGNSVRIAALALVGSLVALGVAGFQVIVEHYERAQGFGSNPIASATVALFLGFFALLGLFAVKGPRRFIFLLGPVFGVATVLLAGSRGPLIALPALLVIALAMVPIRRAALVGAVAALIVCAGAAYAVKPSAFGRVATLPQILSDLATGHSVSWAVDPSANMRFRMLEGSIAAFRESPWLGYGWYMKVPVVAAHITESVSFGDPMRAHLHSDVLNLGVSAGAVGLLAYLLVLLAPIVSAAYAPRDGQYRGRLYAALCLSAGYLCCGAVNLLFGFEFMTTIYVCLAAIFIGYCRDAFEPAPGSPEPVLA